MNNKPSATARFAHLEIGEDHTEFNTPEDARLHVAKQIENLAGYRGTAEGRAILDEVAAGYDFTPPPMERELLLRELRARMWAEEDAKQARRIAGKPALLTRAEIAAKAPTRWQRFLKLLKGSL